MAIIVTAIFGRIPFIGAALGFVTNNLLASLTSMAAWFADLPGTIFTLPVLTAVMIALFYGLLLSGRWLQGGQTDQGTLDAPQRRSFIRHFGAASGLMIIALVWTPLVNPAEPGAVDFYMLDVGQGDSFVLRAGGKTLVIDAGPDGRGRLTVEPFLRTMNIDRIDCLIATHADADHIGGMADLVEHFSIGRFIEGNDTSDSELYVALKKVLAQRRVPVARARAGDLIEGFGPARIRLLSPIAGMTDNNGSVVVEIDHQKINLLLMGDLETAGEEKLESAHAIGDVEVLKVGHHGSRSSTGDELIRESRPELSLISVGAHNRFGHPAAEVVGRLERAHSQILRTDRLGAIWLHSDGNTITAYRYRK
jgi:competence protein ComEC